MRLPVVDRARVFSGSRPDDQAVVQHARRAAFEPVFASFRALLVKR